MSGQLSEFVGPCDLLAGVRAVVGQRINAGDLAGLQAYRTVAAQNHSAVRVAGDEKEADPRMPDEPAQEVRIETRRAPNPRTLSA